MSTIRITILLLIAFIPIFAHAQSLQHAFIFPLKCELGQDCWVVNYMDTDPGPGARDHRCAHKTYNEHKGTDFALRDRTQMNEGVDVLAAANGTVLRTRDGESDSVKTEEQYQGIRAANRDCGNGVLIQHDKDLSTFYCHLRAGSIVVKSGQSVKQGEKIAQIGQSGFAEFPHLHFSVIGKDSYIDPFTGLASTENCKTDAARTSLWETPMAYEPYTIFTAGFTDMVPNFKETLDSHTHPKTLPQNAEALLFWLGFYQAQSGDTLKLRIVGPNGQNFVDPKTITIPQSRKRPSYHYLGRKTTNSPLKPGRYQASATYQRTGHEPFTIRRTVEITP